MILPHGSRLGPYEIVAPLGAGGMGEVYRARDPKLGREIAIKVLPAAVAQDTERLARFRREAQTLASLNHPNIAAIYGLEDAGDTLFLVLELVEGEDLAERLKRGAIPLDEALPIAKQIADALEEAHERGIVHRDVKPANVKITPGGKVKVLDFGLAKALESGAHSVAGAADPSKSPTLTSARTAAGIILGTAAYMAPEQAKGKTIDRRADIWAFGVVLWECLTGKALFAADTVAETIGHVMTREPDPALLPRATPVALRELIARCLVRDPRHRLQAIGDARIALEQLVARPEAVSPAAPARRGIPRRGALAAAAAVGAVVTLGLLALAGGLQLSGSSTRTGTATGVPRRVEIVGLSVVDSSNVAISPDGNEIIGYDMTPSRPQLLRRSLDSFEIEVIPGTESGFNPFFSPDGRSIGFIVDQQICVLAAGSSLRHCLADAHGFAAGSWGRDGSIVYSSQPSGGAEPAGLWRVPSAGGEPVRLTAVDAAQGERGHVYPQVLPDGRNVLYSIVAESRSAVAVVPLAGGAARTILDNAGRGRYVRSGHLVYWDEPRGRLSAVRFDLEHLAVTGAPVELGFDLSATGDAVISFDVSDNGTLVYSIGAQFGDDFTVEIADRGGQLTTVVDERASWGQPRVSPDGTQVLLRRSAQPDCSLWLLDLERRALSRLSLDGDNHNPLWLADGESFLISRQVPGSQDRQVFEQRIDGGGPPERVVTTDFAALAESVSPDGRFLALTRDGRRDRNDILVFDRQTGETRPFVATDFDEDHPAFSPDGTLLAYAASDTGRSEVYVRPFPGPGATYAISTHGGTGPVWSRDGRELFYAEGNKMMRAEIQRAPRFAASTPQRLFESADFVWERRRNYDVLPDGRGFIIVRRGAGTPTTRSLRVVFDWFAELERLAPAGAERP